MRIVVQKFGGSSLSTVDHIRRVAERVAATRSLGPNVVVVVSAMGDTTDHLLGLMRALGTRVPPRELDALLATGEQVSTALLAAALQIIGCPARSFTGWQAGITTDRVAGKARIVAVDTARLRGALEAGWVPVVAGFQGISPDGDVTTLGRGGSDTTAVALAAVLQAEACEIFSDVEGVYTADPRVVSEARRIPIIAYDEMMEIAHLGAQVLQIRAVECAAMNGVTITARSTFTDGSGTRITSAEEMAKMRGGGFVESGAVARAVAHDRDVAKLALCGVPDRPGIAMRVFQALAERNVNVDMIIQSQSRDGKNDIAFTVAGDDLEAAREALEVVSAVVGADATLAAAGFGKVSLIGAGMASHPGVAGTMFAALAEEGINIDMISTSEIKISCLVEQGAIDRAVRSVHRAFGLDRPETGSA